MQVFREGGGLGLGGGDGRRGGVGVGGVGVGVGGRMLPEVRFSVIRVRVFYTRDRSKPTQLVKSARTLVAKIHCTCLTTHAGEEQQLHIIILNLSLQ